MTTQENAYQITLAVALNKVGELKGRCEHHNVKMTALTQEEAFEYIYTDYYGTYAFQLERAYRGYAIIPKQELDQAKRMAKQMAEYHLPKTAVFLLTMPEGDKYTTMAYAYIEEGAEFKHSLNKDFSFQAHGDVDFSICNDCGKHIERKKTFWVRENGSGKVFQVGGACVKKYDCVSAVKQLKKALATIAKNTSEYDLPKPSMPTINFLEVAGHIADNGYISASKARWSEETVSTSDHIHGLILDSMGGNNKQEAIAELVKNFKRGVEYTGIELVTEFSQKMIDWADEKLAGANDSNYEFLNNVASAVKVPAIHRTGIICWAVNAFVREYLGLDAKQLEAKKKAEITPLDLPVGKTRDIEGDWEIFSMATYSNEWGTQTLVKCKNADNKGLQFYIAPYKVADYGIGSKLQLRAGVKGLNQAKNLLNLTRVKIK